MSESLENEFGYPSLLLSDEEYVTIQNIDRGISYQYPTECRYTMLCKKYELLNSNSKENGINILLYYLSSYPFNFYDTQRTRLSLENIPEIVAAKVKKNDTYYKDFVEPYEDQIIQKRLEINNILSEVYDEKDSEILMNLFLASKKLINDKYLSPVMKQLVRKIENVLLTDYHNFLEGGEYASFSSFRERTDSLTVTDRIKHLLSIKIRKDAFGYREKEYKFNVSYLLALLCKVLLSARESDKKKYAEIIEFCNCMGRKYKKLNREIMELLFYLNREKLLEKREDVLEIERCSLKGSQEWGSLIQEFFKKYSDELASHDLIKLSSDLKYTMLDVIATENFNPLKQNSDWTNAVNYFKELNVYSEFNDITEFKNAQEIQRRVDELINAFSTYEMKESRACNDLYVDKSREDESRETGSYDNIMLFSDTNNIEEDAQITEDSQRTREYSDNIFQVVLLALQGDKVSMSKCLSTGAGGLLIYLILLCSFQNQNI
jgi:hypothetical protein